MKKLKIEAYIVQFEGRVWVSYELKAESLESAIQQAKSLNHHDVLSNFGELLDSDLQLQAVFK